jgi:hypothetical protein
VTRPIICLSVVPNTPSGVKGDVKPLFSLYMFKLKESRLISLGTKNAIKPEFSKHLGST